MYITSGNEEQVFGDFSCATRLGYRPLWIVDGLSVELILEKPGFIGTYIERHPLPGEGNQLSFVSIPASRATNNSIVTCAAVEPKNDTILTYSRPAHMIGNIYFCHSLWMIFNVLQCWPMKLVLPHCL